MSRPLPSFRYLCRISKTERQNLAPERRRKLLWVVPCFGLLLCVTSVASASQASPSSDQACPRPQSGATAVNPPELRSRNGVLEVTLHFRYEKTVTGQGPQRYCYVSDRGEESPTLRVHRGDRLIIHFHNDLPTSGLSQSQAAMAMPPSTNESNATDCGSGAMSASVTNLHFHGMSVPPTCHQDDVINTRIQPQQDFEYRVKIPRDEPPGLYWYHPHPHGYSERQVQGGASGALIVEGIEQVDPWLAKLPQRVIVLRDQLLTNLGTTDITTPAWDVSVNYVPVIYPRYQPAVIETTSGSQELWRVVNAGADIIFNLQLLAGGTAQPVQVVALDGVPIKGSEPPQTSIFLPPGARAQFVVATPPHGEPMHLVTTQWDTGPEGDRDPARPLADIVSRDQIASRANATSEKKARYKSERAKPADADDGHVQRRLYFSQYVPNPVEGDTSVFYYITVVGQKPALYRMGQAPNIVVHQGDVEDWEVENRALEDHVFHIHQIHFQVVEVDGRPAARPEIRDTINLPHWSGSGPYPSVRLRMDFGDPNIVGTFLYHCHILKHEDMGMMGVIQVLPPGIATTTSLSTPSSTIEVASPLTITAVVSATGSSKTEATGSVQFTVDGINAGAPVPLAQGRAVFTTTFDVAGDQNITATYSGDSAHDESLSRALRVKISDPN